VVIATNGRHLPFADGVCDAIIRLRRHVLLVQALRTSQAVIVINSAARRTTRLAAMIRRSAPSQRQSRRSRTKKGFDSDCEGGVGRAVTSSASASRRDRGQVVDDDGILPS
jgi:hypothetical protein